MPSEPSPPSLPLDQAYTLLTSFNSFLTVAIHNILFYRGIYPSSTFLSSRAYNLPVHQNRHPKVCTWIRDAIDAVATQLAGGHVARVAVVIHAALHPSPTSSSSSPSGSGPPPGAVLERWLFDVSRFPAWPGAGTETDAATGMRDFGSMFAKEMRDEESREEHLHPGEEGEGGPNWNWTDVDEQFRGALRRMAHAAEGMAALPEGCTFTVALELKEEGEAPIGHPQAWIPSQPNLQPASKSKTTPVDAMGGAKTTPIRSVEAGPLFFECWVEASKVKEVLRQADSLKTQPT